MISHLLWPKDRLKRMEELHELLMATLKQRMFQHMQALQGFTPMPAPLNPVSLTRNILEIQRLMNIEQQLGPRRRDQLTRLLCDRAIKG